MHLLGVLGGRLSVLVDKNTYVAVAAVVSCLGKSVLGRFYIACIFPAYADCGSLSLTLPARFGFGHLDGFDMNLELYLIKFGKML